MSYIQFANKVIKIAAGPLGILEDWAMEPLKRWENKREQENKDNDVRREIERQSGVEKAMSEIRMKENEHSADLQIRMQTEINRINAETEQWKKDKEFERGKKILEAIEKYQKELMELNTNAIRAIGEMDLSLREKAQNLVLEKTKQYKQIQDESTREAEEELERIETKFHDKEAIKNIMFKAVDTKLTNIIEACGSFIAELNSDIKKMNDNINLLTQNGQVFIQEQLKINMSSSETQGFLNINQENIE